MNKLTVISVPHDQTYVYCQGSSKHTEHPRIYIPLKDHTEKYCSYCGQSFVRKKKQQKK